MSGLRARTRRLCEKVGLLRANDNVAPGPAIDRSAIVAHALYHRERDGQSTSLRQIHLISDIGQPEALRIVADLEEAGLVRVERDIHDALESRVELTERMRGRLAGILELAKK